MVLALITGILEPAVRQALRGGFPLVVRTGILVLTIVGLALALLVMVVAGGAIRNRIAGRGAALGAA
jgi:hypothetical protein